ncbi:hypothetical protein F1559_002753 [Cyanidiococcus yangmingshanensis]|uniref:Protein root UVB sensitive/RUS domain-containing protein n=1 Tax=Cyanidiococcus yangmingshanensis TaxID=2690220 RepID=A0A7J7IIV6_9RHOD|nr:hypothetical protein F1559_002753 [Cyanidiococcus yangmingshanensis]
MPIKWLQGVQVWSQSFVPVVALDRLQQRRWKHSQARKHLPIARDRIEEKHEPSGRTRIFERDLPHRRWKVMETRSKDTAPKLGWNWIERLTRTLLLPAGYPRSVSSDYDRFWPWNIARHTLLEAAEVLGTQSMLLALGIEGTKALPLAAAWKWVLKDGLGYFAKVALATQLAPRVDADPKRFRLYGDLVMALGTFFEILTLTFPSWFLILASVGNLLRKAADVATGPAYRVFLYHFSIRSNSGDVSSKSESQVVVGRLTGIGTGIAVSAVTSNDTAAVLVAYGVLSAGHLFATYQSVVGLALRTLNRARLEYILTVYVDTKGERVPDVAETNIAERERMFFSGPIRYRIRFIDSLGELIRHDQSETQVKEVDETTRPTSWSGLPSTPRTTPITNHVPWERFLHEPKVRYLIAQATTAASSRSEYLIALRDDATAVDILQALLHVWQSGGQDWPPPDPQPLRARLEAAGWDTNRILWYTGSVRLSWDLETGHDALSLRT